MKHGKAIFSFYSTIRDAPPWGTWLRKLHQWGKVGEERGGRKNKVPSWGSNPDPLASRQRTTWTTASAPWEVYNANTNGQRWLAVFLERNRWKVFKDWRKTAPAFEFVTSIWPLQHWPQSSTFKQSFKSPYWWQRNAICHKKIDQHGRK